MGDFTQRLASIHTSSIVWFVVALSVLRLALVRSQSPAVRAVVEIVEAALVASVVVFLLVQPFLIKAFYIPSPSMVPTLIDNDHILVNKFEYRVEQPHHQDIVVFAAPPRALETGGEQPEPDGEPTDYIKRLIGLPGDTIQVQMGYVQAGNITYDHDDITQRLGQTDAGSQFVKLEANDMKVNNGQRWLTYTKQDMAGLFGCQPQDITIHPGYVMRNGVKLDEPYTSSDPNYDLKIVDGHSIRWVPDMDGSMVEDGYPVAPEQQTEFLDAPPGKVPAGDVLVMGDNRDDSNDSSEWGMLAENRLVGKAFFIFYPFDRIGVLH